MKYAARVICRPELAGGFALAGLVSLPAEGTAQAAAALEGLLREPGIGVVLIQQGYHDALPLDLRRELSRRPLPMLVPFAGPEWDTAKPEVGEYIVELLRQAIGYRVRLR